MSVPFVKPAYLKGLKQKQKAFIRNKWLSSKQKGSLETRKATKTLCVASRICLDFAIPLNKWVVMKYDNDKRVVI